MKRLWTQSRCVLQGQDGLGGGPRRQRGRGGEQCDLHPNPTMECTQLLLVRGPLIVSGSREFFTNVRYIAVGSHGSC
jgi:hypothetical protein